MADKYCPYCKEEAARDYCDSDGYDIYEEECKNCGKTFKYTVYITYDYLSFCFLEHDLYDDGIPVNHDGGKYTSLLCSRCNYHEFKEVV